MNVVLPHARGELVGVWRLRMRPHTPDVGAWLEQEGEAIKAVAHRLEAKKYEESRADLEGRAQPYLARLAELGLPA